MSELPLSVVDRFWKYVEVNGVNECWPWSASLTVHGGYGQLNDRGKLLKAHRISYEIHYGGVPEGMFVCHRCNNPKCCNPKHLYAGTPKQNWDDTIVAGTRYVPKLSGESVYCSKLKESEVIYIRQSQESGCALAIRYGVTKSAVSCIRRGKTWKHLL